MLEYLKEQFLTRKEQWTVWSLWIRRQTIPSKRVAQISDCRELTKVSRFRRAATMIEVVRWGFLYATMVNGQWSIEIGSLTEQAYYCEWQRSEKELASANGPQNPQMQMWVSRECTKFKIEVVNNEFEGFTDVWLKAMPGGKK